MYNAQAQTLIKGQIVESYNKLQAQIELHKNTPNSEQYPGFDWHGYVLDKALLQNHNLSFSGSTYSLTPRITCCAEQARPGSINANIA